MTTRCTRRKARARRFSGDRCAARTRARKTESLGMVWWRCSTLPKGAATPSCRCRAGGRPARIIYSCASSAACSNAGSAPRSVDPALRPPEIASQQPSGQLKLTLGVRGAFQGIGLHCVCRRLIPAHTPRVARPKSTRREAPPFATAPIILPKHLAALAVRPAYRALHARLATHHYQADHRLLRSAPDPASISGRRTCARPTNYARTTRRLLAIFDTFATPGAFRAASRIATCIAAPFCTPRYAAASNTPANASRDPKLGATPSPPSINPRHTPRANPPRFSSARDFLRQLPTPPRTLDVTEIPLLSKIWRRPRPSLARDHPPPAHDITPPQSASREHRPRQEIASPTPLITDPKALEPRSYDEANTWLHSTAYSTPLSNGRTTPWLAFCEAVNAFSIRACLGISPMAAYTRCLHSD